MKTPIFFIIALFGLAACQNTAQETDATGNFEATEVIVSAEATGKILFFEAEEGQTIAKDSITVVIDESNLNLQKSQVEASMNALDQKTVNVSPQIRLLDEQIGSHQSQLAFLKKEKTRVENLVKADAATTKQLDEINNQIDLVSRQIGVLREQKSVQENNFATQNRSILSEKNPLQYRVAQIQDQINRTKIRNPLTGTILTKYAQQGEVTAYGKALYKIADLSDMILRAYISGGQLSKIRLNQDVKILVDDSADSYKSYNGKIVWISSQSEFTPKTIQTKDERANLVYAIKIKVKNDGYLKIGMYGEVLFSEK